MYLCDTGKGDTNIPRFTGTSDFDDAVTLVQGTSFSNKLGNWVKKTGDVVFMDMPFEIGNNTIETDFNDNGATVVSPGNANPVDPTVRITDRAMVTYLNLRNNSADTAVFSGTYIWGSRAAFDWDQDDSAIVTFTSPTFTGMGGFTLGSSITGPATWDDVDPVILADTGVDIDGSTFRNQNGSYALEMTAGAMDITDMRFESYASAHAILIDTAGTYNFDNVFFDQTGTNDIETTHASGVVTINVSNGGTVPTVTVTGAGTVVINNDVTTLVHVNDNLGADLQNCRVYLKAADGTGDLPFEQAITSITRSGTTATATFGAAHGMVTGDLLKLEGITDKTEDNAGTHSVTVTGTTTCTYTTTDSGSTSYTGTILGTGALLNGLTSVAGDISVARTYALAQPVDGVARISTSSPRFKSFPLSGIVSTTLGLSISVRLILDE